MSIDPKPGLIERTLCRLLEYQDIRDDGTGELYLRRFFLWRNNTDAKNKNHSRVYLHKFYRGDKDRDHHDHPWVFRSLILKGGYVEETEFPVEGCWKVVYGREPHMRFATVDYKSPVRYQKHYGPGSYLYRPATWAHRVIIAKGKTAWTLVVTGPKERSWGFHTLKGFCNWRNYKNGVCFCYDDPNEERHAAS